MSTLGVSHPSPTMVEDFHRVLDERAIQPLFQPLVDLEHRHVLGYEALAGGPMGSALESPAALFGAACRAGAFTGAVGGGLVPPMTLFVNAEPVTLGVACPDDPRPAVELGEERLRVVLEVTDRAVAGDPARLLATVAQASKAGWGVALDDVGAAPASLAVLPFVRPDLIKLDMRLLQGRPPPRRPTSSTPSGPRPSGPTPWSSPRHRDHRARPRGGGRRRHHRPGVPVGHPAPLPSEMPPPTETIPLRTIPVRPHRQPPGRWWPRPRRRAVPPRTCWSRPACSWTTRAWTRPSPTCCWPASRTPASSPRRPGAGTTSWPSGRALTGALGHGMPVTSVAGVRGADLAADDPLRREWDLIVIGPRFAAALVAHDLGDDGPDGQRRYDVVVSHDRELVIRAAEPLLRRLVPRR